VSRNFTLTDLTALNSLLTLYFNSMMNLQLLVHAAEISGNSTYLEMATSHANKTLTNQIRADGSSFHVVDYSPTTGEVQWSGTAQGELSREPRRSRADPCKLSGYSNSSTWSRGQAWGINGFALMYNATLDPVYLDTSRRMASYFVNHLPVLGVSYWCVPLIGYGTKAHCLFCPQGL